MRSQRDVLIGLFLALTTVAVAVGFGPGAHHPLWRDVAIACGVAAVVILVYLCWPQPSYVTDVHETQLRMMLRGVHEALESQRVINLADMSTPFADDTNQIFRAHFPDVVKHAQAWNDAFWRNQRASIALTGRARSEVARASFVGSERYAEANIARGIVAITTSRAESQQLELQFNFTLPDPVNNPQPVWRLTIVAGFEHFHLGNDEAWAINVTSGDPAALVEPVNELLLEAQQWDEAREVQAAHLALDIIDRSRITDSLRTAGTQYAFRRARKCPECRKQ